MFTDFFRALANPDLVFLRYALWAGLLSSLGFGIMGTYVVVKRISSMAGAISHAALGGIGAALYLGHVLSLAWITPQGGAVVAAILSALIIGWVSRLDRRIDSIIGAIWAIGMALGLVFLDKTPGYQNPMNYLFGNILLLEPRDLWLIISLDCLIIICGVLFYRPLQLICYDEEFAQTRGIRPDRYRMLLLILVALTVVLMVRVVGLVMVIALLTIPAAAAGLFAKKLWQMMIMATIICGVSTFMGLALSYYLNLPSGAVTILVSGTLFLLLSALKGVLNRRR